MYDLILKNATIITMDKELSKANWVAVKDKKIAKIGIGECTEDAVEVLDLTGKTVLPGLWDSHMHLLDWGFHLKAINMGGVGSVAEAIERIAEGVKKVPAEQEWVIAMDYLAGFVKEQRFPRAAELDPVTGNHKLIVMSPTMHAAALNTAAMNALKNSEDLPGVEKIDGKATGVYLADTSAFAANSGMEEDMSREDLFKAMENAAMDAAKNGCTSIQALVGFDKAMSCTETLVENLDRMPINTYVWSQSWDVKRAKEMGLPRVGGCLNLDGASFEHTAAMFDGYTDAPHLRGERITPMKKSTISSLKHTAKALPARCTPWANVRSSSSCGRISASLPSRDARISVTASSTCASASMTRSNSLWTWAS